MNEYVSSYKRDYDRMHLGYRFKEMNEKRMWVLDLYFFC